MKGSSDSRCKRPSNPEAKNAASETGEAPEAVGQAEALRIGDPGPAAGDMPTAISARPGRTICRRSRVVSRIAVLHPLHHVAGHVVEAECIWLERSDR